MSRIHRQNYSSTKVMTSFIFYIKFVTFEWIRNSYSLPFIHHVRHKQHKLKRPPTKIVKTTDPSIKFPSKRVKVKKSRDVIWISKNTPFRVYEAPTKLTYRSNISVVLALTNDRPSPRPSSVGQRSSSFREQSVNRRVYEVLRVVESRDSKRPRRFVQPRTALEVLKHGAELENSGDSLSSNFESCTHDSRGFSLSLHGGINRAGEGRRESFPGRGALTYCNITAVDPSADRGIVRARTIARERVISRHSTTTTRENWLEFSLPWFLPSPKVRRRR